MTALKKGPWYNYHDEWKSKALNYLKYMFDLKTQPEIEAEVKTFLEYNISKVIFESNLIEGAGLSEGDTRKILDKFFPQIPPDFFHFREASINLKDESSLISSNSMKLLANEEQFKLSHKNIIPSISMARKSRKVREVITHYIAILESILLVNDYVLNKIRNIMFQKLSKNNEPVIIEEGELRLNIKGVVEFDLFTEDNIKALHKTIAKDLLPKDANVKEGEYRIDNRIAGWDITFPSPELLPKCMDEFFKLSNQIIDNKMSDIKDPIDAAAKISHHFVKIHPFPDFNGRLSRIIMNMVLMASMSPFPVAIRGNKKDRHRYFIAIKRANGGDIKPLSTLICMQFVQTVDELNSHLRLAGLPSVEGLYKTWNSKGKNKT